MSRRRGSGSIFRQPGTDRFTLQYYNRGKRIRESTGLTDRKAAQQQLTQRLSQIDKGEYIERPMKPVTVAELYEELEREYGRQDRRSLRSLKLRWKHLSVFFWPDDCGKPNQRDDRPLSRRAPRQRRGPKHR